MTRSTTQGAPPPRPRNQGARAWPLSILGFLGLACTWLVERELSERPAARTEADGGDAGGPAMSCRTDGECADTDAGSACCAEACVTLAASTEHCGACGHACGPYPHAVDVACVLGECRISACAPLRGDCDGAPDNGCEHDLSADLEHCGGCGEACLAIHGAASCAGGVCGLACEAGRADCDASGGNGCETPLDTDAEHCGACDTPCLAGRTCVVGVCTPAWVPMSSAGAPTPREGAASTWIGDALLVWGGRGAGGDLADGALYDPVTDGWTWLPADGAPSARVLASAAWTGDEVVLWGGGPGTGETALGDGARWRRATGLWSPMSAAFAPSPRRAPILVWTGTHVIVWGGTNLGVPAPGGGRYAPATDVWLSVSASGSPSTREGVAWAWSGEELYLYGGRTPAGTVLEGGHAYDPEGDAWRALPALDAPGKRHDAFAVWIADTFLVWGGFDPAGKALASGARYHPKLDAWLALPSGGKERAAPATRTGWAGAVDRRAIFLGGLVSTPELDGWACDLDALTWAKIAAIPSGLSHEYGAGAWSGREFILFGGRSGETWSSVGERLLP